MEKRALGKGLDALIGDGEALLNRGSGQVISVEVDRVIQNEYQPRKRFEAKSLAELKSSIQEKGVIQPILVRRRGDGYQLIAGERRLLAARDLGLKMVPALVKDIRENQDLLELSLIENIQREDLNPLEKAKSYQRLIDEFGLTQEQVAKKVGKERSSVSNTIRLLDLEDEIKDLIREGKLNFGQARALLGISDPAERLSAALRAADQSVSVREIEEIASARKKRGEQRQRKDRGAVTDPHIEEVERRLRERLKTKVTVVQRRGGRGKIEVEFFSLDEFDRIIGLIASKISI